MDSEDKSEVKPMRDYCGLKTGTITNIMMHVAPARNLKAGFKLWPGSRSAALPCHLQCGGSMRLGNVGIMISGPGPTQGSSSSLNLSVADSDW